MGRMHSAPSAEAEVSIVPEAVGPYFFWTQDTNDLWGATIAGDVLNPDMILAGTGDVATGFESLQAPVSAAVVGADSWVYVVDLDVSTGDYHVRRVKIDGSDLETLAVLQTALSDDVGGILALSVDNATGDAWLVARTGAGNSTVQLIKVTLAGVATAEKTFTSAAYEYGFLQVDAANGLVAVARGNAVNAVEIYDMSDFTSPVESIANTYGSVNVGAPFVMTDGHLYAASTDQSVVRYDRSDYTADAPDPWMDVDPDFIDHGIVDAAGEFYAVVFNDTTSEEELRRVEGGGGPGTTLTGWPTTQGRVDGYVPTAATT